MGLHHREHGGTGKQMGEEKGVKLPHVLVSCQYNWTLTVPSKNIFKDNVCPVDGIQVQILSLKESNSNPPLSINPYCPKSFNSANLIEVYDDNPL